MATYHEHRKVWVPDLIIVKGQVMLDPKLTPMENCWKIINMQAQIWLCKFGVFSRDKESIEDLEQMTKVAIYNELLRRVRLKQYDRKFSFWLNVRSCALAVVRRTIDYWGRHDLKRREVEVSGDAVVDNLVGVTLFDTLASHEVSKPITEYDYHAKYVKTKHWSEAKRKCTKLKMLRTYADDLYSRYCEECEEFGITPIDRVSYLCNTCTDEEIDLLKLKRPLTTLHEPVAPHL